MRLWLNDGVAAAYAFGRQGHPANKREPADVIHRQQIESGSRMEAAKGFRRLKAYKQLPRLRAALDAHATRHG
jgi:hypothetical protein